MNVCHIRLKTDLPSQYGLYISMGYTKALLKTLLILLLILQCTYIQTDAET